MRKTVLAFVAILAGFGSAQADWPASGTQARYRVLPGEGGAGPGFQAVTVTYGPKGWWEVAVFKNDDLSETPMMMFRGDTSGEPTSDTNIFKRYLLRIPETNETYDYRDANNPERALLPGWGKFYDYFLPRPAKATRRQQGMPNTSTFLGHVLTLKSIRKEHKWKEWDNVTVLNLDREFWIGTSRTVKDAEEHRLPQHPKRQNYTYVQWTRENYETLIEAGMNYFALMPGIEEYVRSQPVFYRRGNKGNVPLRWPADLYRSNLVGPAMFIDEPSCRLTGNENFYNHSTFFTDMTAALMSRVQAETLRATYALESQLRSRGVSFGHMRLINDDYVSWETRYSTAYYQFAGGVKGFVHEGRYQLGEFNEFVRASTGLDRIHTAEEMFRYVYGIMRGAARRFGGDWGTSIYGQADPALSPMAMKIAYDMGARHLWYWTSDHDHHMPWPEQLELTRTIRQHAAEHPRPSIRKPQPVRDKLITLPMGYFPVLESPTGRKHCWDLWWVRELDAAGKNESSQRYRRIMRNLFVEVHKAFDANEDFDVTIDDGTQSKGYRKVVRITDK